MYAHNEQLIGMQVRLQSVSDTCNNVSQCNKLTPIWYVYAWLDYCRVWWGGLGPKPE